MKYIEQNLLPDEKIVYSIQPHWMVFAPAVVVFILGFVFYFIGSELAIPIIFGLSISTVALLFVLIISIFTFGKAWIAYSMSEYGVTNRRVIMKEGWLQRYSLEIFLDRIEAVFVRQNLAGQVFNYGNVIIVGTGGTQDIFSMIPDPFVFRKKVEEQMDLYKKSRS